MLIHTDHEVLVCGFLVLECILFTITKHTMLFTWQGLVLKNEVKRCQCAA